MPSCTPRCSSGPGIATLNEGQRVLIDIAEGRKGPEAVRVRLA